MTERDVKIVVAEGASGRKGLLRFVLESEGYRVVGEASTSAELAQALETQHPDVVVMDDGIGATAVGMTHDLAPAAKVILVWPEAVVPIGGDAAVEPSSVLRQLGPTVERLTGAPSVTGRMGAREGAEAAGIGMLSLGAILAMGRAAASPSEPPVPLAASVASDPAEPVIDDRGATPMLILPPTADVGPDGADLPAAAAIAGPLTVAELEAAERRAAAPVPAVGAAAGMAAVAAGAATAGAGTAGVASGTALNRRLGTLALGGAALAGSLVLALALSGSRVPAGGVRGEAPTVSSPPPVTSSPNIPPPRTVAIPGALLGDLGGSGTTLALVSTDVTRGSGARTGAGGGGPTGGTGGNSGETPTTPPTGAGGSGGGSGSVGSGGGGGGSGGSGDPGGSGGGGSDGGSNGGGSFFGGGGGGGKNGGGECEPIAHDGDGRTSEPCVTDDDGLDGTHHGHDDSDHDGDGYQGDGDHQADHDGDGCDGHDDSSDHGHDGDDGDHQHDHGDEHDGDHGGDGYGS